MNNMKQPRMPWFRSLFENSAIFRFLTRVADWFAAATSKSAVGSAFLSYDRLEELGNGSILLAFLRKNLGLCGKSPKGKRRIAAVIEHSRVVTVGHRIAESLAGAYLPVYGMFFLSFGFYLLVSGTIRLVVLKDADLSPYYFVLPGVFLPSSVPLFFGGRRRIGDQIAEGKITSWLIFNLLGLRRAPFVGRNTAGGRKNVAFICGMVLGVGSYFTSPLWMLAVPVGLLAVYSVLASPEAGLLVTLFSLPILIYSGHPSVLLCALVGVTFFSFLAKAVRGKRYVYFETFDLFMFLFAFVFLLGAAFGFGGSISNSLPMYLVLMLGYFLCANLMTARVWLVRGCVALLAGGGLSALYGIYQYFTGNVDTVWLDTENFSNIAGRAVSFFENPNMFGEFMMMLLPVALCFFLSARGLARFASFALTGGIFLALIFSWARGAWLGAIAAVLLFIVFSSKKTVPFLLLFILFIPLLPVVLPESVVGRLTSIGDMTDSSTSYRYYIWKSALDMIRDFGIYGIGVGRENFSPVYIGYSYSGIESAPHAHNLFFQIVIETGIAGILSFLASMFVYFVSGISALGREKDGFLRSLNLACMCGAFASLVQGMTDYVWYNYRVFFAFYALIGIGVAARRCGELQRARERTPEDLSANHAEISFRPQSGGETEEYHESIS